MILGNTMMVGLDIQFWDNGIGGALGFTTMHYILFIS